ncbi:Uncharacterised protein [Vibrio cholerae]|nr:Uncharacterised protein [Vibrio cholerae]
MSSLMKIYCQPMASSGLRKGLFKIMSILII